MEGHPFNTDPDKNDANYVALSPLFPEQVCFNIPEQNFHGYMAIKNLRGMRLRGCLRLAFSTQKRGV